MKTLFGQIIFVVAEREYGWEDVILAAQLRGAWAELETQARAGLACQKRLAAEGGTLDKQEVDEAATEFRYAHDLISAQETSEWLKRWGLTAKNWMDYLRRERLRARWAEQLADTVASFPATDEEVAACLKAEAVCAGRLKRFAEELAAHAAALERGRHERESAEGEAEGTARGVADAEGAAASISLSIDFNADAWPGLTEASFRQKLAHIARLEDEFQHYRQRFLTPKAVREQVKLHGLDWIRVSVEAVSFPSEAEAREAVLCVRQDGMRLAEVAADAKRKLQPGGFYLDEMEANLKEMFLALGSGELSDPVNLDDRYALYLMIEKVAPDERDPEIQRRAKDVILASALTQDVNQFVRWRWT